MVLRDDDVDDDDAFGTDACCWLAGGLEFCDGTDVKLREVSNAASWTLGSTGPTGQESSTCDNSQERCSARLFRVIEVYSAELGSDDPKHCSCHLED